MVERALARGSSTRDIRTTVGIVSRLSRQECFRSAVGPQVVGRMEKPLAMASATIEDGTRVELPVER